LGPLWYSHSLREKIKRPEKDVVYALVDRWMIDRCLRMLIETTEAEHKIWRGQLANSQVAVKWRPTAKLSQNQSLNRLWIEILWKEWKARRREFEAVG
jgi:hypothetical protein